MRVGSDVVYAPDELLFGVMVVRHFRGDGQVVCRVYEPDGFELFGRLELRLVEVSQAGLPNFPGAAKKK